MTVADLRRVRPGVLDEVAGRLRREQARVLEVAAVLLVARVARLCWAGAAADAAGHRYLALSGRVSGLVARLGASVAGLESAAPGLRSAMAMLFRAGYRAAEEGAWVDEWGGVRLAVRVPDADVVAAAVNARREALVRAEVEALVARALAMAPRGGRRPRTCSHRGGAWRGGRRAVDGSGAALTPGAHGAADPVRHRGLVVEPSPRPAAPGADNPSRVGRAA